MHKRIVLFVFSAFYSKNHGFAKCFYDIITHFVIIVSLVLCHAGNWVSDAMLSLHVNPHFSVAACLQVVKINDVRCFSIQKSAVVQCCAFFFSFFLTPEFLPNKVKTFSGSLHFFISLGFQTLCISRRRQNVWHHKRGSYLDTLVII